jgi:hypothetical protein
MWHVTEKTKITERRPDGFEADFFHRKGEIKNKMFVFWWKNNKSSTGKKQD